MHLDPAQCYRALSSHDPRFDGRLFVGVTTTGIYCRPVCRARQPRPDRCRFFATAARAEADGFRPCLRCRPELAPGNAAVDAGERLAGAAASLIEDGVLDRHGVDRVAARLGVTSRHLRRVFETEFGVTPIAFAQTQRLLLAKRLLADTSMSVTDVALASGFTSLRRFNALVRARYGLTPTALRAARAARTADGNVRCALRVLLPYDWAAMCNFLGARAVEGVEAVRDGAFQRVLRLPSGTGWAAGVVEVAPASRAGVLDVSIGPGLLGVVPQVLGRVKHVFDVTCRPAEVKRALGPLGANLAGLRVPGTFDGFELAARAVLGQQVTVQGARTLAGRLVSSHGSRLDAPRDGLSSAFPDAGTIAVLSAQAVAAIGVPMARARTIVAIARAITQGRLQLEPGAPVEPTMAALRAIPGVGEWTAEYVAMRALGWPDAFPAGDLGVQRALGVTTARAARRHAEAWRPWRAYAVMHLWRGLPGRGPGRAPDARSRVGRA